MKRCPTCNYENTPSATYCEQCGSLLAPSAPYTAYSSSQQNQEGYGSPYPSPVSPSSPASDPYASPSYDYAEQSLEDPYRGSSEYPPPPPPPVYAPAAQVGCPHAAFALIPLEPPHPSIGSILLCVVLYLWGATAACFGFAGWILSGASSTIVGLAFIGSLLISMVILVATLFIHKR